MVKAPAVLVVEDEYLLASALEVVLKTAGARVVGPAARVSTALELIASGEPLDCALLDIRLDGEPVFPVAEALLARGVRFAFLTGYERTALPPAYQAAPYLSKTADPARLVSWVMQT